MKQIARRQWVPAAAMDGVEWSDRPAGSYPDSKLFVTTLAAAVARIWPNVYSNAVDPG